MKRFYLSIILIVLSVVFILPTSVLADNGSPDERNSAIKAIEGVIGTIAPPEQVAKIGYGNEGIATLLNNTISIIFVIAGIAAVFMVLISGVQFIFSGGDKEAVGNARKRLTYAIIGLVILALAFWIVNLVGAIAGFEFFGKFQVPATPPFRPEDCRIVNGVKVC